MAAGFEGKRVKPSVIDSAVSILWRAVDPRAEFGAAHAGDVFVG